MMAPKPTELNTRRVALDIQSFSLSNSSYLVDYWRKESGTGDISEIYHENTKRSQVEPKFSRSMEAFNELSDEMTQVVTTEVDHPERELIELPEPDIRPGNLADALRLRRSIRRYSGDAVPIEKLSTILFYGCGMAGPEYTTELEAVDYRLRTYPSAGAMYPVNPYLMIVNGSEDVPKGLYYYSAKEHGLRIVQRGSEPIDEFLDQFDDPTIEYDDASLVFVFTGEFWRTKMKYGPRGYRFVLLEAGHLSQNVQLVATSLGLGSVNTGGLAEDVLDSLLGANGVDESTIYGTVVGYPSKDGDFDE